MAICFILKSKSMLPLVIFQPLRSITGKGYDIFMRTKHFFSGIMLVLLVCSQSYGQDLLNVGIGPTWPKELNGSEKPTAWNATLEYGKLFDNIIGLGVDFDLSWNKVTDDTTFLVTVGQNTITKTKKYKDKSIIMFPISAFLLFDPIPKFKVHPVIKGQFGLNMAVKSLTQFDTTGNEIQLPDTLNEDGFYIGLLGKVSADAVFDLGEHAALFAGFEFQWGKVKKKVKGKENEYFEFNILGPALRMGFSFLF